MEQGNLTAPDEDVNIQRLIRLQCWAVNVMSHLQLVQEATPIFNANPEGGVYLITSSVAVSKHVKTAMG